MNYRQCSRCVMDTTDPDITFDGKGICNHCYSALAEVTLAKINEPKLAKKIEQIKKNRVGEYDCLIGLSGGVDSSMALYHAISLGLKPLAFTIDNGWNTPESDENIMRLVEGLKVPFYRYSIDRKLFTELQNAFLKAGLINVEIPTDHIIMAATYELAAKYEIKWVISGGNISTESIMPHSWSYPARDLKHIKDVYQWATGKKLKGLPVVGLFMWNIYRWLVGLKTLYILDYTGYNRGAAIELLSKQYGYKDYGAKHEESVWTKWFQNFYLYEKFGIDKRKAHLSSLINSHQITRDEALAELEKSPIYPKLGIEQVVLKYPKHSHYDFATDEKLFKRISKIVRTLQWKF